MINNLTNDQKGLIIRLLKLELAFCKTEMAKLKLEIESHFINPLAFTSIEHFDKQIKIIDSIMLLWGVAFSEPTPEIDQAIKDRKLEIVKGFSKSSESINKDSSSL